MNVTSVFKNIGHAFAVGAKYFDTIAKDVVHVAAGAQAIAPEVDAAVGMIAGPQAAAISDIAFHVFGDVAAELDKLDQAGVAAVAQKGVNVQLDLGVVEEIKKASDLIKSLLAAKGTPAPASTPAA